MITTLNRREFLLRLLLPLGVTAGSMNQTYDMTLASSYNPSYVTANGGTRIRWESESLTCRSESGAEFALAAEGEHRIVVTDLQSGRCAETWIRIRSL